MQNNDETHSNAMKMSKTTTEGKRKGEKKRKRNIAKEGTKPRKETMENEGRNGYTKERKQLNEKNRAEGWKRKGRRYTARRVSVDLSITRRMGKRERGRDSEGMFAATVRKKGKGKIVGKTDRKRHGKAWK